MKDKYIQVRIDDELKDKSGSDAKAQGLSLSEHIRKLLEGYYEINQEDKA